MNDPPVFTSFEQALEKLEESVSRLEKSDLPLAEALQVFEQGLAASRACTHWLDQTRKRVQLLIADEADGLQVSFLDTEEQPEEATQEE